jgi:RNA 2',3'-cyclic 3'-phosphodiesterase
MGGRGERSPGRARRLFVAVEVPPRVHRAVERAIAPWRDTLAVRWVPSENRHVTVRFLGAVRPESIDRVRAAVASAAATVGPVRTRLTDLGAFPSSARARVLWAGLDDRGGRLAGLAIALDAALAPEFPPQTRAFRPHLTLARCDPPVRLPPAFRATPVAPVAFEIVRVVMFESVLGSGPPRYEAVEVARLRG